MNHIAEQVRINLKIAREEARLTQGQLADMLQKSRGTVTQWECGTREIHYDALLEIAPVLGKSWLWFYQDHKGQEAPVAPTASATLELTQLPEDQLRATFENWLQDLKKASGDNRLTKWPPHELAGIQSVLTSARAQRALFAENPRTGTTG